MTEDERLAQFTKMVTGFSDWLMKSYQKPGIDTAKYSEDVKTHIVNAAKSLNPEYTLLDCPPGTTPCSEGCCDDGTIVFRPTAA